MNGKHVIDVVAKGEPPSVRAEPVEALPDKPRHPTLELLALYKAVLKATWSQREELAGPRRLADEVAFLPAALIQHGDCVHDGPASSQQYADGSCAAGLAGDARVMVRVLDMTPRLPKGADMKRNSERPSMRKTTA